MLFSVNACCMVPLKADLISMSSHCRQLVLLTMVLLLLAGNCWNNVQTALLISPGELTVYLIKFITDCHEHIFIHICKYDSDNKVVAWFTKSQGKHGGWESSECGIPRSE